MGMCLHKQAHWAKYNIKRGQSNKSNHSSFMNQSDMRAKYRKKFRAILQKNKLLARALVDARAKISELEGAGSRQQKIDNLALPQIKLWLETNLQLMHTIASNSTRGIKLLQDIMTPGQDISLTGISDMDLSYSQERRRSLHPPGRQGYDEFGNVTVIPEESDSMIDRSEHLLNSVMIEEEPEVDLCSRVTVRRKSRNTRSSAGRRSSLLDATPVAPDVDQDSDSAVPTFKETVRQNSRNARWSGPADFSPSECPSPLTSTALLEHAFIESPTSTLQRQGGNLASLETTAPSNLDETLEAAPRRQSARKSCMSRASDVKKSSRVTFVVNKAREGMAAAREAPRDFTPVTVGSEEPRKAPHRATYFVSKPEETTDAPEHEGLGDVQPRTVNTEVNVVEHNGDLPEKKEIEAGGNSGGTMEKEVSQKADSLSKQARRTGKKSRGKPREVSPVETEPPRKSDGPLNPEPMDMDVGAGSCVASSTAAPCRGCRNLETARVKPLPAVT
ncbi:hypothetical protein HPB52_005990 [Rhipicephalus sanguineus]|uniref:Shugoshin C-terminal domain-containing protein n=1 Tax=Rhipicephalus sanguineus TaxID=34632 RepID=A0A9D4PX92_RHISA|nr:hypothetical protein HPB52_005990 [Rhipicephalus sanguineus]